jgi:hypothetical protein
MPKYTQKITPPNDHLEALFFGVLHDANTFNTAQNFAWARGAHPTSGDAVIFS